MRQFILDSLTLFYDAWFRPTRLQQRLNEWIPPEKGKQDTSWWKTIILPTSRPAWRIWLLCLPWWLVGAFLAVGALWDGVSSLALLFVGAMLILVGWGTSVWSPTLGLAVPALLAVVWSAQPATLQVALERSMNVLSKYLAWRTSPLIWFTALAVGLEGAYWAVSTRRWRLARVIGHVASYLAGDMALLLAVGVALGVTLGVAFGVAGGMALFVAVVLAFVVAFVTAFTMMATASSDAALCVAVAGGVALGVALVLVLGVAGLAVLLPGPAWSLLGLVAAALGRRPRWWGALLVACSLAALRVESAGWWDAAVVLGLALLAYYRLPWQVAPWLAGHRAYFSARHWTTGYEIQAVQPAPAGVGRLLSGVPPSATKLPGCAYRTWTTYWPWPPAPIGRRCWRQSLQWPNPATRPGLRRAPTPRSQRTPWPVTPCWNRWHGFPRTLPGCRRICPPCPETLPACGLCCWR